jgi:hypothetical protein
MPDKELDEAKLGTHSVDTSPVEPLKEDNEDDEFDARFKIETEAVFKRLARDIYESDAAGIREPLTNAITAILRAVEYDQIEEDEGVVEITVKDSGNGIQLTMRDNGVGMTMERIQKIVAVIGASEARDIGDLAGQFGMGFLAIFRLVGIDGGFEMHTNARYSDEGPISGIWKSGGFTRDTKGLMSEEFEDDEYGTKFNFIVKDEISRSQIRDWVETYSEWARVPVVYEEITDGRTEYEENYGGFEKTLRTSYDEKKPVVEYEDEFVSAVSSPEADSKTILLDVPCERKGGAISTFLGGVDIRLKNENGVVVQGSNKGDMVVSEGEYKGMDEERQEKYVSEENLTNNDIILPQPTGTRRVLESNDTFWNWIQSKLERQLINNMKEVVDKVDNFDDLMSLDEPEFRLICHGAKENVSRRYSTGFDEDKDGGSVKKWFKRHIDRDIDDRLAKQLAALVYNIRHAEEGTTNVSSKRNLSRKQPAMAVYDAYNNSGDIYMGCRLSQDKAKVIWEDSDHNYIFRVESTDHYDIYEKLLNWSQMKEISKDNIDDFDISESTKANYLDVKEENLSDSQNKETYKIKLHFRGASKYTTDVEISDLEEKLEDSNGKKLEFGRKKANNIILFPSHKDKKISNNYWASDKRTPVARCRKKDWEKLKEYDQIETLDQRIESAKSVDFKTSRGNYNLQKIEDDFDDDGLYVMFHIVDEPYINRFASDELINYAEEFVNDEYGVDDVKYLYAPITAEKYQKLKPVVIDHCVLRGDFGAEMSMMASRMRDSRKKRTYHIRNDTRFYAYLRLNEWKDTPEYKSFYSDISRTKIDNGGYELVETLRKGLEQGAYSSSDGKI